MHVNTTSWHHIAFGIISCNSVVWNNRQMLLQTMFRICKQLGIASKVCIIHREPLHRVLKISLLVTLSFYHYMCISRILHTIYCQPDIQNNFIMRMCWSLSFTNTYKLMKYFAFYGILVHTAKWHTGRE